MAEAVVASRGPLALIEGFRGHVIGVSRHSIHVVDSEGALLVVHDAEHGHTPTSLLVAQSDPVGWGVTAGHGAAGRLGRLRIGPLVLDARHTRVWQPPAPQTTIVDPSAPGVVIDGAGEAASRLDPACRRLTGALEAGGPDLVGAALLAMIGAGPGLTPSGDDAVVGLLAVVQRIGAIDSQTEWIDQLRALVPPLLGRTTVVSAHYLRLALAGHCGEHLTNLVDACGLTGGPPAALVALVRETGATSGADALVGVAGGLSLLLRRQPATELEEVA